MGGPLVNEEDDRRDEEGYTSAAKGAYHRPKDHRGMDQYYS